jgi:hypothetical protein
LWRAARSLKSRSHRCKRAIEAVGSSERKPLDAWAAFL